MTTFSEGWQNIKAGISKGFNRYQAQPGSKQIRTTVALLLVGLAGGVTIYKAFSPNLGVTEPKNLVDLGIQPIEERQQPEERQPAAPVIDACSRQAQAQEQLERFMGLSASAKQEIATLILEIADSRGPARKDWTALQALQSSKDESGLDVLLNEFSKTSAELYGLMEDGSLRTDANTVQKALPKLWLMLELLEGTEAYLKDNSKGRLDFVVAEDAFTRADSAYRAAKAFQNRKQFDMATEGGCANVSTEELQ